jgi:tRNA uridine 5-carboxymethylaminomethyl modification enzyme
MLTKDARALDLLRRPDVEYSKLVALSCVGGADVTPDVAEQVAIQTRYAGYVERQRDEVARARRQEETTLPADFDFSNVRGLSNEVRQKFEQVRPQTIGQASRIPGVTPAAISLLLVHLKKRKSSLPKIA